MYNSGPIVIERLDWNWKCPICGFNHDGVLVKEYNGFTYHGGESPNERTTITIKDPSEFNYQEVKNGR